MNRPTFVIGVDNFGYPASLEKRKIYESVADPDAEKHGQLRVIDESGEDYPYPQECFVEARFPDEIRAAVARGGEPPRVRVGRDDDVAKYWLDPVRYDHSLGFRSSELRKLQRMIAEHQVKLPEA